MRKFPVVAVLKRTAKKCTKIYNARAQLLFCSLNLLFSDVPVAVAVVVFLNSLLSMPVTQHVLLQKRIQGQHRLIQHKSAASLFLFAEDNFKAEGSIV